MKLKRILSFIMAVTVLTAIIPFGTFTANAETVGGSCGYDATWSYDTSTYTLTISGTGSMNNYSQSSYNGTSTTAPWKSKTIKKVVFESGISSIGDYAFYYCTGLTSITMSDSIRSIGARAFNCCSGLTSITIPYIVRSIGDYAFANCTGLTSITIPNSVTSIGYGAFGGCKGLTSITIPNSVTSIGDSAFDDCEGLTSITIPNSVTSIGDRVFYGCEGLTSITIPNSVTSIGDSAFGSCKGLTSITIPNSVTSIGSYAFNRCTGLTSIAIPNSVTSIGYGAFDGCEGLKTVYYCGTEEEWNKISINYSNSYLTSAKRKYHLYNNEWLIRTSPTCTTEGLEYSNCTVCGEETTRAINALGHSFKNYISDGNATCTADGTKTAKCDRCDVTYTIGDKGSKIPHDYINVIDPQYLKSSADCLHAAVYYKSCSRCGQRSSETFESDIYMSCGENCGFIIKDNTLYIYGDGETSNYKTRTAVPWYDYADQITEIQIDSGINKIGNYAFYCCNNLNTVTIRNRDIDFGKYVFDTSNKDIKILAKSGGDIESYCEENGIAFKDPRSTVLAPDAPDYQNHTDSSITLVANDLYEFSIDGDNWQKSSEFTGLSKNTVYRFYQRIAETETEFASPSSAPLVIAIPDKPEILEAGYENLLLKKIDGFEYCLDDFIWQDSNEFEMLIDNTEYYVYQRLKAVDGEKVYQITSYYTAVTTDNSIIHTHTESDWVIDIEPSVSTTGKRHKECTLCGKVIKTEVIPDLHTPGDINDDGKVNSKDLVRLFQYLTGWDVEVNRYALDINGDGKVNNRDLVRLFQYLSGWYVEIH